MSEPAGLRDFSQALDLYPAAFSGNRLNLLLLEDAEAIRDARAYLRNLDSPSLVDEQREYLIDENCAWPFPRTRLEACPDPWDLSRALFERFDEARSMLLTQTEIAEVIDQRVRQELPQAVALIIADGLSYFDLSPDCGAEPVLVPGITSTAFGYRETIGKPSISRRLFALGYANQLGFTYFDPISNDLARDVYASFGASQISRVRAFDEVLEAIGRASLGRSYFQITMSGLDQLCHAHWDDPPRKQYTERILGNYDALGEALHKRFGRALTILTADHGILWRELIEDKLEIADDLFVEDIGSPRYVKGSVLRAYGRVSRSSGQNFTLLGVPYATRRFRRNEWGVHGGISAWESIVPLLMNDY